MATFDRLKETDIDDIVDLGGDILKNNAHGYILCFGTWPTVWGWRKVYRTDLFRLENEDGKSMRNSSWLLGTKFPI